MFHENSIWTEEQDPVNTATQKKKKSPSFSMGKPVSAAKAQESEMSQKPQGVGKEMAPHHTSASPAVYRRILCAHLHTELAALHCSTPHFLLPDFLQPHFTSTVLTPQTLGCPSVAFQSS